MQLAVSWRSGTITYIFVSVFSDNKQALKSYFKLKFIYLLRILFTERDKIHEQEKKALNAELEAERQSRQKLLSAQYELQERIDSLQR